jgi:PAS domain S-box-containing protein
MNIELVYVVTALTGSLTTRQFTVKQKNMKTKIRILYIDDNGNDRQLVNDTIHKEPGFEVVETDSREDFEKYLSESDFDLVLGDYNKLGFVGLQIIQVVKKMNRELPVIIVTGSGNEEIAVQAMKMGAADYVIKSVEHIRDLVPAIKNVLEHKKLQHDQDPAVDARHLSEACFRSYFELSNAGFAISSPTTKWIEVNDYLCKLLGYSREALLQKKWTELTHPDDLDNDLHLFNGTLAGEIDGYSIDKRFIGKNGEVLWTSLSARCIRRADGKVDYFVVLIYDITKRKQNEELIQQDRIMLRTLIDNLPAPVYILDKECRKIVANKADYENIGYSSEAEILGKNDLELFPGETGIRGHADNQFVIQSGIPIINREEDFYSKNNTHQWLLTSKYPLYDSHGKISGLVGIGLDITKRKEALEALKKSEEQFHQTMENMLEGCQIISFDWQYIYLNKTAIIHANKSKGELIGHTMMEVYPDIEKTALFEVLQHSMNNRTAECIVNEFKYDDGTTSWFELSIQPVPEGLFILSIDITERKKIEEKLNESKELFENFMTNLPAVMFMKDQESRLLYANPVLKNLLGWHDAVGKLTSELVPSELAEKMIADDRRVFDNGPEVVFETIRDTYDIDHYFETHKFTFQKKNGEVLLGGISIDETARKKAEETIRENKIDYKTLADSGQALIWTSGTDKKCNYFNQPWLLFTGRTLEQELGDGWVKGVHPDDLQHCVDTYNNAFDQKEKFSMEYRILHASGEYRWILDDGNPRYSSQGTFIGYIGHCLDITERKKTEEQLILAKEKAEESDKLKTAFLSNISHEIRTPMNAIMGFLPLLATPDLPYETQLSYIESIKDGSNQLLSIINDIVDISRIEANVISCNISSFNLNSALQSLYNQFILQAPENNNTLKLTLGRSEEEVIVQTDSTRLIQILSNLLNNAFKFTTSGNIEFGYTIKRTMIEFFVSDTGIGIASGHQSRVFDSFYQVENSLSRQYRGTGLGLAICKAYTELLGGKIWLESEIGKGSVFYFTIPYILPKTEKPEKGKTYFHETPSINSPQTILVVEDEDNNYALVEHMLYAPNIKIVRATNGYDAVELCRTKKNISLVLMDIKMPRMDGFAATELIKDFRPSLPVIAQTAYITAKEKALKCGCSDFISKPYSKEDLLSVIRKHLIIHNM